MNVSSEIVEPFDKKRVCFDDVFLVFCSAIYLEGRHNTELCM